VTRERRTQTRPEWWRVQPFAFFLGGEGDDADDEEGEEE